MSQMGTDRVVAMTFICVHLCHLWIDPLTAHEARKKERRFTFFWGIKPWLMLEAAEHRPDR
jgi:hypothetical protein